LRKGYYTIRSFAFPPVRFGESKVAEITQFVTVEVRKLIVIRCMQAPIRFYEMVQGHQLTRAKRVNVTPDLALIGLPHQVRAPVKQLFACLPYEVTVGDTVPLLIRPGALRHLTVDHVHKVTILAYSTQEVVVLSWVSDPSSASYFLAALVTHALFTGFA
jgi:hypothetical protein